jgi:hypothetical protein
MDVQTVLLMVGLCIATILAMAGIIIYWIATAEFIDDDDVPDPAFGRRPSTRE